MDEITITICGSPKKNRDAVIQNIKNMEQELSVELEVSILEPALWLSNRDGRFRLYYSKCRFIETDNRHLVFHYDGQRIRKTGKISEILKKLPEDIFFRCNNSYIVNLNYITSIVPEGDRYDIHLSTGETIPLSRSRYRKCRACLTD